jgi:hypothetical protein
MQTGETEMQKYLIMIAMGVVGAVLARKVPVIKDL